MEKKKVLILLTDEYPYGTGETFVANEVSFLAQSFSKVIILTTTKSSGDPEQEVPDGVDILSIRNLQDSIIRLLSLRFLFTDIFWQEIRIIIRKYKVRLRWSHIKIMLAALSYASVIKRNLLQLTSHYSKGNEDIVLYSYWMGNKALAAAMLMREFGFTSVCRAHNWDIYFERHEPPYLPFRMLIYDFTRSIYFVSEDGRNYFLKKFQDAGAEKCKIALLGTKSIGRNPEVTAHAFTICSCASLTNIKRIHLIPEILYHLKFAVHWIHFGSGELMEQVQKITTELLKNKENISFEFKGQIDNSDILNFYSVKHIDLFLLTSLYEGIPVAIMESLSAGIPVVATSVCGIPEIVNEENGFLLIKDFDPKDAANVISKYFELPESSKKLFRDRAYLTWKEKLDASKNYPKFIKDIQSS